MKRLGVGLLALVMLTLSALSGLSPADAAGPDRHDIPDGQNSGLPDDAKLGKTDPDPGGLFLRPDLVERPKDAQPPPDPVEVTDPEAGFEHAAKEYARQYGVSVVQAKRNLNVQGELVAWHDTINEQDDLFAAFEIQHNGNRGVSAVMATKNGRTDFDRPKPANVEVVSAKYSMLEGRAVQAELTDRLQRTYPDASVTFEAIGNRFTAHVQSDGSTGSSSKGVAAATTKLRGVERAVEAMTNLPVEAKVAVQGESQRGNLPIRTTGSSATDVLCTTAAGVYSAQKQSSGILTAGHCKLGADLAGEWPWVINPQGQWTDVWYWDDYQYGAYKDRVIMGSHHSSPKIVTAVNNPWGENFFNSNSHMVVGVFACGYGRQDRAQPFVWCASVTDDNQALTPNPNWHNLPAIYGWEATRWSSPSLGPNCIRGDSGGAIWINTVSGKTHMGQLWGVRGNDCIFLSAKDQIHAPWGATGGWVYQ